MSALLVKFLQFGHFILRGPFHINLIPLFKPISSTSATYSACGNNLARTLWDLAASSDRKSLHILREDESPLRQNLFFILPRHLKGILEFEFLITIVRLGLPSGDHA